MIMRDNGKLKLVVENLECPDVRERIRALTNLVAAADPARVPPDSIYWTMMIINDHLPDDRMVIDN